MSGLFYRAATVQFGGGGGATGKRRIEAGEGETVNKKNFTGFFFFYSHGFHREVSVRGQQRSRSGGEFLDCLDPLHEYAGSKSGSLLIQAATDETSEMTVRHQKKKKKRNKKENKKITRGEKRMTLT